MEPLVHDLDQLHLVDQGIGTHHITITLIELPITTLLRAIRTPNGLDLVALEREADLIAMLHHETCERHGQVITQTFLTGFCGETKGVTCGQLLVRELRQAIA